MKNSIRILAAFAAVLMLLGVVACGNTGSGNESTAPENTAIIDTGDDSGEEGTAANVDKDGFLLDDLPNDLKFNETVRILYWNDVERPEFEVLEDQLDGNIVSEAIYSRNINTEAKLGVTFEWTGQPGNSGERANFTQFVMNSYKDNSSFDIIAAYSRTAGMLSRRGLLVDMNSIDKNYIDTDKPWWPSALVDAVTIDGSLYFISGDISTNVLHFMYAIYYNIELLDQYHIEDPVNLVDSKQWTIDKLIELTTDTYQDADSDTKVSVGDFYGFASIYYHLDAFYTGSGLTLINPDSEDMMVISPDYFGDKEVNLVDKLGKWLTTNSCYISRKSKAVDYYYPFVEGRGLFCQNRVYMADAAYGSKNGHNLNSVTWNYGIVPTPLYDADQENYVTVIGNPFTLWGIMAGVSDERASMSTAVIESLGSQAYRRTTPALFETNMKYRYTNSGENKFARMFDILHNTISFDLGRIFSDDMIFMSEIPSIAASEGNNWAIVGKSYKTQLDARLKALIKEFEGIKK